MYIKDNRRLETPRHITIDGVEIDQPTHEQLIANGWVYVSEESYSAALEAKAEALGKTLGIARLKEELARYDYIGVKIATGVATIEEYAGKIEYMQELRRQINELQGE